MRRHSWGVTAVVVAAAVVGALTRAGGGTAVLPPETDSWIQIKTAHFVFYSNAPEKRTLELGRRLEKFRAALALFNPKFKVDAPVVTSIYVFRNDLSLTPYKVRFNGRPVELNGLFVEHPDGNYIIMNGDKYQDPQETIYHEYTHHFLGLNLHAMPPWFNEGLAECYSTFRADSKSASLGLTQSGHILFLREHPLMPLHDLFAIDQTSPDYNEGDRRGVFYAESWALLHYLMWDKPERRPQLMRFLDRLGRGEAPDPAFDASFGCSYETLENELRAYVAQKHYTYTTYEIPALKVDDTATVAPMKRSEVLYRLGDLLAHIDRDRAEEAGELFREAQRLDPDDASSYAGLAYLAQQADHYDVAVELYDKAFRLDPDDAVASLHFGQCLLQRTQGATPPSDLVRAQELFGNAIRVQPDFAEVYVEYAWTLIVQQREVGSAIRMLETARRLLPARTDIVVNLAALYARKGDAAKARDLVENALAQMNDREALARARQRVESEATLYAREHAEPGPPSEPSAESAGLDDEPPPLPEIQPAGPPEVAIYNEAVARANKRDYKGAIALLEGLLKQVKDDDMRAQVRTFLDRLRKDAARLQKSGMADSLP